MSTTSRRIAAIMAVDHPGGAEIALLRLLSRLAAHGWRVTMTTPATGPLRDAALVAGYRWRALPVGGLARRTGKRAIASWPAARRLAHEHEVVYLNGAVCGRLLPALGRSPLRLLHVHAMGGQRARADAPPRRARAPLLRRAVRDSACRGDGCRDARRRHARRRAPRGRPRRGHRPARRARRPRGARGGRARGARPARGDGPSRP